MNALTARIHHISGPPYDVGLALGRAVAPRLARTIDRWSTEVLAYHSTGQASNGRVENVHMLAEKIRRNAHGFANHHNYRRRLIGRLGIKWATVPTRRIRGRQPRSVA